MNKQLRAIFAAAMLAVLSMPLLADSDRAKLDELEVRIEMLQVKIGALEAHHTFTSFMPDFAERFHVMHRAGDAGDWAVASHELSELQRITKLSTTIDADKGRLMQQMMKPSFEALENAIGHGNHKKFLNALTETTNTCNACHTATGSGFVQVTLDADESLSFRHPHKFKKQGMMGGHTH